MTPKTEPIKFAGTTVHLDLALCVIPVISKTSSALPHNALYLVIEFSFSSSNQYRPIMPCLDIDTHAVHFVEYNGLYNTSSGAAVPNQLYFICLYDPETETALRLRPKERMITFT